MMPDPVLAFCALVLVASLGVCLYDRLEHRPTRRAGQPRYRALKPRPVAAVTEGLVAVEGTVVPGQGPEITSPLSGRSALGYSVRVKATSLEGQRGKWDWCVQRVGDFVLQDDAGDSILVLGAGAHLELRGRLAIRTTQDLTGRASGPLRQAFRKQRGSDELFDRTRAAGGEHLLRAGDRVRIYGEAAWRVDASLPGRGLRDAPGALCIATPQHNLEIPLLVIEPRGNKRRKEERA
jgi:hypothetical protein